MGGIYTEDGEIYSQQGKAGINSENYFKSLLLLIR